MSTASWSGAAKDQVQGLALTGYPSDLARHFVLKVIEVQEARAFIARLLHDDVVTFGGAGKADKVSVNIGFTYQGLRALRLPLRKLDVLAAKSPAFAEGAPRRAARWLGDAGASAVEHWDDAFKANEADVWVSLHGDSRDSLNEMVSWLRAEGKGAFDGWDRPLKAEHLGKDKKLRYVHFGFRDNIARPVILDSTDGQKHTAGELLLGYDNDSKFDFWGDDGKIADTLEFFRNASFGVLRKIEQNERGFKKYLLESMRLLRSDPKYAFVTTEYLKAKMCGRWRDGALVEPGDTEAPPDAAPKMLDAKLDPKGEGCPFGAHIRRSNPPEGDNISPARRRPLFRRGIPYGKKFDPKAGPEDRGLMGVFFCASIEDQFERLISEWIEKNPMGPPTLGRAKDPLVGHHDDPDAQFCIPLKGRAPIMLRGFAPFVRTCGTLYALFPSRSALAAIAGVGDQARSGGSSDALPSAEPSHGAVPPAKHARGATSGAAKPPDAHAGTTRPQAGPRKDTIDTRRVPRDRFCDIVMEGGITSGIIYSTAVAELADHYRFKNIGGSSIGAFAAALTAAAEYRRREGSNAGFKYLRGLPDELARVEGYDPRTLLQRMFVPQPETRRLFAIFLAALNRASALSSLAHGFLEAVRQYRDAVVIVAAALLAVVLAGPLSTTPWSEACSGAGYVLCGVAWVQWIATILLTLGVSVISAVVARILWDLARRLVPNGFGLCRGWSTEASEESLDLSGFLHGAIQKAAGRDPKVDPPLTFEDLWSAPGSAADLLRFPARGAAARSINLEVYASNLAHGRPYRFPLDEHATPDAADSGVDAQHDEDMGRLFFRSEEMQHYFPKGLVKYLRRVSQRYQPASDSDPPESAATDGYLELPTARLPIVVAARFAMSFPLLISAVPLYAIDYEPKKREDRTLKPCWMSDGGLCSNFPIHLFDSWIPKWPTFGISLQTRSKVRPKADVWLPKLHRQGRSDTWDHGLEPKRGRSALRRLGNFLLSLWKTTWHWNDSTMMRMPGVRDRVVRVFLKEGEGGVNICMGPKNIRSLARTYGKKSARAFVAKFAAPKSRGWAEHRWVRFNVLLIGLRDRVEGLRRAAEMDHHAISIAEQIEETANAAPLRKPRDRRAAIAAPPWGKPEDRKAWPSEEKLKINQVNELRALLDALCQLEDCFVAASHTRPFDALPRPSLRIRHPT